LLILKAIGIESGDEVIIPSFTFFATAGVISRLGATPVFVDIFEKSYNINTMKLEESITSKTKAIMPVHLYGQQANMDEIMKVAKKYDLKVIEDACQAIGSKYNGHHVAHYGDAAALSFFPSKNLGAYGDAGMVLTNSDKIAKKVKKLRVHGAGPKYYHSVVGYNSRLDSIQAATLNVKIKYLDKWNKSRQKVSKKYIELFKEYNISSKINLPTVEKRRTHVFHQFVIRLKQRDFIRAKLNARGISTGIYYPQPLHLQECYKDLGYKIGDLPVSEKFSKEVLALPIDPSLTEEQLRYIVITLKDILEDVFL
ncbi:MAG: DegT/DnrJ/EryC1/StrS family aminotransferase, partial [Halanaerobiales bacterium]|nr:DegT/DnrJ/EryC1/StrS family aminotransferase [Halanaerobiales bacterium]